MDTQQIRTVLAVAERLSFSAAAFELSFTTSAVSKQVAALEKALGVVLFHRKGRTGVFLTEDGRRVLPHLKRLAEQLDQLDDTLNQIAAARGLRLSLGYPPIFPPSITSELISEFMLEFPNTDLQEIRAENEELLELLYRDKLDVGVATLLGRMEDNPAFYSHAHDDNLVAFPVMAYADDLLLSSVHPMAVSGKPVDLKQLIREYDPTFLFINRKPDRPSVRQNVFVRWCEDLGFTPKMRTINLEREAAMSVLARYIGGSLHYAAFVPEGQPYPQVTRCSFEDDYFMPTTIIYYLRQNKSAALRGFVAAAKRVAHRHMEQANLL